jgi:hypothetical protein
MGLGGAGVALGAVLGGLAAAKLGESNKDDLCDPRNRCNDAGRVLRRQASGLADGSTVAIIAGAAVLAGGVVLFATAPRAPAAGSTRAAAVGLRARVALAPGFVRVEGAW